VAEDPTETVTIQYPPTQEIREVARGALKSFVNKEQNWVVLDKRGHVSASATAAEKKEV
jgi:rhodanese-related sulfurtransferase